MNSYAKVALLCFSLLVISCTDNATKLGFRIEKGAKSLEKAYDGAEESIVYEPVSDRDKPYTVIILPEKSITKNDLVIRGVSNFVADQIFRDLNYVHVQNGRMIIVYQDGQIYFTTYGLQFAITKEILIGEHVGKSSIVLRKEAGKVWIAGIK